MVNTKRARPATDDGEMEAEPDYSTIWLRGLERYFKEFLRV